MGLFEGSLFGEEKPKKKRDKRRAFTESQKKAILHQQNMKCAKCKKKLDIRAIDFDHKKPWADGGRTATQNGRALHPTCHRIVTHKQDVKKADKKSKKSEPMVTVDTLLGGKKRIPKSKARRVKNMITGKMEWEEKLF